MNEVFKDVIYIAIVVLIAVISYYAVPYIKILKANAQSKEIFDVISKAVRYAEQKIVGEKKGKERFNAVQMYISNWLNSIGIKISEKDLEVLIEAAVYIMNNT